MNNKSSRLGLVGITLAGLLAIGCAREKTIGEYRQEQGTEFNISPPQAVHEIARRPDVRIFVFYERGEEIREDVVVSNRFSQYEPLSLGRILINCDGMIETFEICDDRSRVICRREREIQGDREVVLFNNNMQIRLMSQIMENAGPGEYTAISRIWMPADQGYTGVASDSFGFWVVE